MPEAIEKRVVGSAVGVVEDARLVFLHPCKLLVRPLNLALSDASKPRKIAGSLGSAPVGAVCRLVMGTFLQLE